MSKKLTGIYTNNVQIKNVKLNVNKKKINTLTHSIPFKILEKQKNLKIITISKR